MIRNLEELLGEEFPNLYKDLYGPANETAMHWGFTCDNGWFKIIWELSKDLESMIIEWKEENPGVEDHPRAAQVKEKFGNLRVYLENGTEEMYARIEKAVRQTETTCEHCGSEGILRTDGWIRVLCESCEIDRQALRRR